MRDGFLAPVFLALSLSLVAVYPNMRTALRTYHPVPSLQTEEHSQKEMSDAPRIKGVLKGAVLDWENNNLPTTLKEVARRRVRAVSFPRKREL